MSAPKEAQVILNSLFMLVLDPLYSQFAGEILGVIIRLLFNPVKQRGRLGKELLEQRNYDLK